MNTHTHRLVQDSHTQALFFSPALKGESYKNNKGMLISKENGTNRDVEMDMCVCGCVHVCV